MRGEEFHMATRLDGARCRHAYSDLVQGAQTRGSPDGVRLVFHQHHAGGLHQNVQFVAHLDFQFFDGIHRDDGGDFIAAADVKQDF